ncbi:hypothetical protein PSOS111911_02220 [Pseudoalteromonas ostreae]
MQCEGVFGYIPVQGKDKNWVLRRRYGCLIMDEVRLGRNYMLRLSFYVKLLNLKLF